MAICLSSLALLHNFGNVKASAGGCHAYDEQLWSIDHPLLHAFDVGPRATPGTITPVFVPAAVHECAHPLLPSATPKPQQFTTTWSSCRRRELPQSSAIHIPATVFLRTLLLTENCLSGVARTKMVAQGTECPVRGQTLTSL